MGLKAVDNGIVPSQNASNVGGLPIPDEERAVIGAGHDVLTITE